jgi:HSP20 family molecular chaperone IbpA
MDAFRKGDTFYRHLDLPGIKMDSIGLTVEQNVPAIRPGVPRPAQPGRRKTAEPSSGADR